MCPRPRRGSILILTLAALIALTSLTLVFARTVSVESAASSNHVAAMQAQAIAQGAAEYVRTLLTNTNGQLPDDSDVLREAVPVGGGYFWLLKRNPDNSGTQAFGLVDEAGKINVNSANLTMLSLLPDMDRDYAAGIIDWRDGNDSPLPGGAESQYYLLLPRPYQAKSDRLETIEELLLVKDITPALLYGEDANRNGVLDANEDDGDASEPLDDRNAQLNPGLYPFVTVYSAEPNTRANGQRRTNVNSASTADLSAALRDAVSPERRGELVVRIRTRRPYVNLIDLYYKAELTREEFGRLTDRLSTTNRRTRVGLINLNSAPRDVLLCLPTLEEADVQAIESRRASSGGLADIAALVDALPREKAVAIGGRVTTRSYFVSADIVAVDVAGRAFKRYLAVYDTRPSPPRIVLWRELTGLGWPLDPAILAALRSGQSLETYGGLASPRLSMGGAR